MNLKCNDFEGKVGTVIYWGESRENKLVTCTHRIAEVALVRSAYCKITE